jgi:hypothetical protein
VKQQPLPFVFVPALLREFYRQSLGPGWELTLTEVGRFARHNLLPCDGNLVKLSEFYEAYCVHCMLKSIQPESRIATGRQLISSGMYLVAKGPGTQDYIANVSLEPQLPAGEPWAISNQTGRLVREQNQELEV